MQKMHMYFIIEKFYNYRKSLDLIDKNKLYLLYKIIYTNKHWINITY